MIFSTIRTIGLALAAISTVPAFAAEAPAASTPATPSIFTMNTSVSEPTTDVRYRSEGVSSSSSDDAIAGERAALSADGDQPPPSRRSYGRSRYQDRMHNADGSTKIAIVGGIGAAVPTGSTAKYNTLNYDVVAGGGYNFNKTFGVLGEFHYDRMNLTPGAIAYQYANYLNYGYVASAADLAGLDGNAHVIAITVNPVISFTPGDGGRRGNRLGAYVTGGVGYYHKVTNFTLPSTVTDGYGNYFSQNQTVDAYSANSFGVNGGAGLTYKMSEFSSERLFIEARYNWLKINQSTTDLYPYNARNTGYIPIAVGIRF